MGHFGSKPRTPGLILGNCYTLEQQQSPDCYETWSECLTISRPSSSMGHVWSKTRSPGQILGNSCLHLILTIFRISSNMGHFESKTRSPGQILGNSCLHSIDHIGDLILMKLSQNVCCDNIQAMYKTISCLVKIQVIRSNLRKLLFTLQMPHLRPDFDETLLECLF